MPAAEPPYLETFCAALLERKATPRTIEAFRLYWLSLSRPMSHCPCPFCFAVGQQGRMIEQTQNNGILPLRCETCGERILLPLLDSPPSPPSQPRVPGAR